MAALRLSALLLLSIGAEALRIPSMVNRRQAVGMVGIAPLAAATPVMAKSKASVQPNKPEGVGANAGQWLNEQYKKEKEGMAGDKGSRGTASKDFDKNDTVQRNRDKNGGLARDASGKKVVAANRNRSPEELGLKQWNGS